MPKDTKTLNTKPGELEQTERLIKKGEAVLATHQPNPPNVIGFPTLNTADFSEWQTQSLSFIVNLLGSDHVYVQKFGSKVERAYKSSVNAGIGILKAIREDINTGSLGKQSVKVDTTLSVEQICSRFHLITRQLRSRHEGRDTLDVQDEYDVQDLMHALLSLHFDDIRPEEYTPSYAGKSSRMDFLLKREATVVEIKKTRSGLDAKELSSQLIEDIERYKAHPDCRTLICFVYDPEGLIANPRGIEADLSREENPFPVDVFIRPL